MNRPSPRLRAGLSRPRPCSLRHGAASDFVLTTPTSSSAQVMLVLQSCAIVTSSRKSSPTAPERIRGALGPL